MGNAAQHDAQDWALVHQNAHALKQFPGLVQVLS